MASGQTIKKNQNERKFFHSDNCVRLPGAVPDKENRNEVDRDNNNRPHRLTGLRIADSVQPS